ncbi:hypothetical protein HAX54_034409, partial [Datura stramonium]|nr:hypothetical protein [Datura stramonium]
ATARHWCYPGATVWLMVLHGPDDEVDGRQTIYGPSLVQGLTVDLTDHQRSDGPSLLSSEGGVDLVMLFKRDGRFDRLLGK